MSNKLYEFHIKLKEKVAETMKKIGAAGGRAYEKLQAKNKAFQKGLDKTNNRATMLLKNLRQFAMVGLASAGVALGAMANQSVKLAANMEQTRVAFQTMLGDAGKGNALLDQLNNFANATPYTNNEVIQGGQILLSAGIDQSEIVPQLGMIGDIASGIKMPLGELATTYSKITNLGKAQREELQQLARTGILEHLANKYGVTKERILEMGTEGKITSKVISAAFKEMTGPGGNFYGMMEKMSQTFNGRLSTLKGKAQAVAIQYGTMLLPVMKKFVNLLIQGVEWLAKNEKTITKVAQVVGIAVLAWLTYQTTIITVNSFSLILRNTKLLLALAQAVLTGNTLRANAAMKLLNITMRLNPIGLVVTAVMLLVTGFILLYKKNEKFRKIVDATWASLKAFGSVIGNIVMGQINNLIQSIGKIGKALQHVMKGEFKKAAKVGAEGLLGLTPVGQVNQMIKDSKGAGEKVGNAFTRGWENSAKKSAQKKESKANPEADQSTELDLATDPETPTSLGGSGSTKSGGGSSRNVTVTIEKLVENINVSSGGSFDLSTIRAEIEEQLIRAIRGAEIATSNG